MNYHKQIFVLCVCILSAYYANAQQKYWVYFKNKGNQSIEDNYVSSSTYENRKALGLELRQKSDIPVYEPYVTRIEEITGKIYASSKWFNSVSVELNDQQLSEVEQLDFVKSIESVVLKGEQMALPPLSANIGALKQIGVEKFEKAGLTGEGVKIGVIDGMFYEANKNPFLKSVFDNNRLLGTRNFVDQSGEDLYGRSEATEESDRHGTSVLSMIAGYDSQSHQRKGFATNAMFYLARTEDSKSEYRGEEDYWVSALEWLDSLGVRLVHTSLGYNHGYDNPEENYSPDQMNGLISRVAKAANIGVAEKGMIIVASAGNNGNDRNWRVVSTPGDSENVITVGATNQYNIKTGYSAIGTDMPSNIKPNVACFSEGGTSLAAPVITGMLALLLEKNPYLVASTAREALEKSAHLYPYANNYLGYGVPRADALLKYLKKSEVKYKNRTRLYANGERFVFLKGKKYSKHPFVVFHKTNETSVVEQTIQLPVNDGLVIERVGDAQYTTLASDYRVIEIIWERSDP